MAVLPTHEIVSFGIFEVDLEAEEVRKAGLRVRLPRQPFRLLATLLAHPGEIVSREELQREMWGSNTNVDFERGIASAVNKLREALGDSAEHPLYIETLARKGYRFIAPVTVSAKAVVEPRPTLPVQPDAHPTPLNPTSEPVALALATPAPSPKTPPLVPVAVGEPRSVRFPVFTALAAVLLVLSTVAVTLAFGWHGPVGVPHIERLTISNDIYPGPPNAETLLSLVTDGPRLYVPTLVDGHSQLSSIAIDGAYRQPVPLPASLSTSAVSDISPDGSRLLVRSVTSRQSEQMLWVVPTTGGSAQRVGEVLAHDAIWMPHDADRILFATSNDLRIVQLGTGSVSPFLTLSGRAFGLRWSPDGRTLRYTLLNPVKHTTELWELKAADPKPHLLSFDQLRGKNLCCGSWTPDGALFLFQAGDEHSSNLWAVRSQGSSHLEQLTNGPLRYYAPLSNRDGTTVFAFGTTVANALQRFDRSRRELVSAAPFLDDAERVTYSRDETWVAWSDSRGRLWRARAHAGEDLLQLTGDGLEVFSAQWSPDGQQLVMMARQTNAPWALYTVNAAGGAVTPLLTERRNLADPSWSADGKQVVFGREADLMGQESGPHDIEILELSTRAIFSVANTADLFSPRWSPDGQWIAALSRDQSRLLLFSMQTRRWTTLYTGGAADPVWNRDSRSVVFHAFSPEHPAILQASVSGALQVVTDLNGFGPELSDNCFFSGLTPDGSPLLKPRVGTGDLYAITLLPR